MPYILDISQQIPGKGPKSWRYEGDESYVPQSSEEVVFSDAEFEQKQHGVWDATQQILREQTSEELSAEAFELAKTDKLVDFFVRALQDVLTTVPEAEGAYQSVPTELLLKALVAHFLAQAEKETGDPTKWYQMLQTLGKLRVKRGEVGVMTPDTNTIEDINAEVW